MFQVKLKELREQQGWSQSHLAQTLGVSQSTVGMWECGRNKPTYAMLVRLSELFSVPLDTLAGTQPYSAAFPTAAQMALGSSGAEYSTDGTAAQGALLVVEMPDDSMEPTFHQGDLLTVQPTAAPVSHNIVACRQQNAYLIREVFSMDNGFILQAENHRYPPVLYDPAADTADAPVLLGKVIEMRRRLV